MRRLQTWLQRWGWLGLLLAAPLFIFPLPLLMPILFLAPLLVWAHLDSLGVTPLNGIVLVLAGMLLVSLYATSDLVVSLPKIAGLLLGLTTYFVVAHVASRLSGTLIVITTLVGAGVGLAFLLPVVQWSTKFLDIEKILTALRLTGPDSSQTGFINQNELAGALVWVMPLAGSLAIFCLASFWRIKAATHWLVASLLLIGSVLLMGLMLVTLLLTQSRTAYAGLAIGVPVTFVVFKGRLRWLAASGLVIMAGLGLFYWSGLDSNLDYNRFLRLDTLNSRLEIWSRALLGLQDFSVTGMGMNMFRFIGPVLYPFYYVGAGQVPHAHNEFLQAGLDLGVPGLIAFAALYVGAFWMLREINRGVQFSWNLKRNRHVDIGAEYLTIGIGAGLLAHLIYGLTDAVALGAKPGILFWMLLGLIAGLYRQIAARSLSVMG